MGFIRLDDVILKPVTRPLAASRHSSRWCSPPTLGGATTFAVGDGRDVTGLSFGESLSSPQRHEDDENAEHGAAEFALLPCRDLKREIRLPVGTRRTRQSLISVADEF